MDTLLSLMTLLSISYVVHSEMFTSISSLKNILDNDKRLHEELEHYIKQEEERLMLLKSRAKELSKLTLLHDNLPVDSRNDYNNKLVEHPVDAYNVIKMWHEITKLAGGEATTEAFNETVKKNGVELPTKSDHEGALAGLVRLQITYNLATSDLSRGRVYNVTSITNIGHDDYLDLAARFMETDHFLADSWLDLILEEEAENRLKKQAYYLKRKIYEKVEDWDLMLQYTKHALELDPEDHDLRREVFWLAKEAWYRTPVAVTEYLWMNEHSYSDENKTYRSLCRGDDIQNTILWDKSLICVYRRGVLPYVRYKEEIHSFDPRISLLIDAISDGQAEKLKHMAQPQLSRATVLAEDNESAYSDIRISKLAWLSDEDSDFVRGLSSSISDMTGLVTDNSLVENVAEHFQIVNYGIGGQYETHTDFLNDKDDHIGERLATFMYYLSEPAAGGATVFPVVGVRVPPVKNAAAFWYNFRLDGNEGDEYTLHAGCPLLLGQKWVGNKWIRQHGQMFTRPCGLTEDAPDPIWYNT